MDVRVCQMLLHEVVHYFGLDGEQLKDFSPNGVSLICTTSLEAMIWQRFDCRKVSLSRVPCGGSSAKSRRRTLSRN